MKTKKPNKTKAPVIFEDFIGIEGPSSKPISGATVCNFAIANSSVVFEENDAAIINGKLCQYYNHKVKYGELCYAKGAVAQVWRDIISANVFIPKHDFTEFMQWLFCAIINEGGIIVDIENFILELKEQGKINKASQMVNDNDCNFVYVSSLLKQQFEETYNELKTTLSAHGVGFEELQHTKDIWCRDYMPLQIKEKRFVQFRYEPSYFTKEDELKKTKPFQAYARLGIARETPNIILDGGNIIKSKNRIIMSDFILRDNPGIQIDRLAVLLGVNEIIIIPHEPEDCTGHADGMIRFVDDNTVLLNDYSMHSNSFQQRMQVAIKRAKLRVIELPYVPSDIKNEEGMYSAKGNYANFLQVKNLIIVPQYGIPEDEAALEIIKKAFKSSSVIGLDCNKIAHRGGVLNCVSWSIKKLNTLVIQII